MLVLTAALVVPYFVDWTTYRAQFEREASRILGRDVEVRGQATARLLPFPSVSFSDVRVSGPGGDTVMRVDTFSMDAELMPFLSGEVLIFDMRLERPEVFVTIAEDGVLDWAVRPSVPVDLRHVTLESMTVTDGRITLRHLAGGREHVFSDINAELSARTLAGPWRATGEMRVDGMRTAMTVTTGTAEADGRLRVRLRAEPSDYPLMLETEGQAAVGEKGTLTYGGQFRVNAHAGIDADAGGLAEGPPDYRISGSFEVDHERLVSEEFRFETGPLEDPYTADGHAMIAVGSEPRFEITAEGVQLRVDEAQGGAARLEERIAALRNFVARLPKPAIPGSIQLDLPAVVAGDTTIREVSMRAEPSEAGWRIAALKAALPGRTALEASGELTVGEELGFSGSLLLAINQPSGFAAWLSRDVDEAIRRLPAAGFAAEVELSERRQSFRDLELVLGASVFRGEIDNRQPEGLRPSMALRLEGEGLDVEGMSAFASLFVTGQGENRLEDHDLDFEIRADDVRLAGVSAGHVDTLLRLREGQLEIDRLRVSGLVGADISATGRLRDFAGTPKGEIDATVIAVDLAPLTRLLAERMPGNRLLAELVRRARAHPGLMEDAEISVLANASAGSGGTVDLSVNAGGRAGGNDLTMTLSSREWTGDLTRSPLSVRLNARADEAADLYGLLGLPGELRGFAGAANAQLAVDGVLDMGATARLTLTGQDARARFEGDVRLSGEEFSTKGIGRLQATDLMPWLMTAAVPLPGMDVSLPAELSVDLDYSNGLLVLSGLEGELAETRLSGELNAEGREGLPHLTGELFVQALDMLLVSEMLFGLDAHIGSGEGWPDAPFRNSVNVPFTADIGLAMDEAALGGAMRMENVALRARLARDGIAVSNLSAAAYGGRVTGLGELRNDGGEGLFSAQLRLDDGAAEQLLPRTGIKGTAHLTATLSSTGKSFDAMFSALAGSGTAKVSGLVLPGADPNALDDILAEADRIGREIGEEEAAAFVPDIVQTGSFPAGEVEFAFSVAGGIVRAPPIQMAAPGAGMTAELSFDIGQLQAEVEATLNYDAGVDGLVGSEPSVRLIARGSLDDLSVTTDTAPLARFLTQRALEREQRRVEDMQAGLLEQQRLRREVRYFAALRQERLDREEERRQAEEQARRMIEDEMRRRAEMEELRRREEERRRVQEEEQRLVEEEERRRAQEEAEIKLQQERRRVEEARQRAEEEARAEEERRLQLEDEIESILRLHPLPEQEADEPELDGSAVRRMPLAPPAADAASPVAESQASAGEPPSAAAAPTSPSPPTEDDETVSDNFLPGVWGIFRPENLSPEGFAHQDRLQ